MGMQAVEKLETKSLPQEGGAAAKSEEPRCVLCEGEDATGYRIDEGRIVPASEAMVEADCFLCRECIERDDFEDQVRAYMIDRLKKQLEGGAAAKSEEPRYWGHRGPLRPLRGRRRHGLSN